MKFIQIVEFTTNKPEEVERLSEQYQADTEGKRTSIRVAPCVDRDNPRRYMIIAEFDSYESAMENSNLAETEELAEAMAAITDGPPRYHNLDVLTVYEDRAETP